MMFVHGLVLCHVNTRILDYTCRVGLVKDADDDDFRLGPVLLLIGVGRLLIFVKIYS